jgi:hypothetical protein
MAPAGTRQAGFSLRFISRSTLARGPIQRVRVIIAGLPVISRQIGQREYEISRVDDDARENER